MYKSLATNTFKGVNNFGMVKIASHEEKSTAGFKRRLFLAFLFYSNGKI